MNIKVLTLILIFPLLVYSQPKRPGSGRSISFDDMEYVNLGNAYSNLSLPITVSVWFKIHTNGSSYKIFTSNANFATFYAGCWFQYLNGNISFAFGDGGSPRDATNRRGIAAAVNLQKGKWYHLTAVCISGTNMKLYVNGIDQNGTLTGSGSLTMYNDATPSFIGRGNGGPAYEYMDAEVDEFSIWNKALTQTEVRNLMCKKLTGNESQLLGYYTFDEGSGSTLNDKSGNGNNGTLISNPSWRYSGAPIGDDSDYFYGSNGAFYEPITSPLDSIVVSNFGGGLSGAHFYRVDSLPDLDDDLYPIPNYNYYWGVYVIGNNAVIDYDMGFYYNNTTAGNYNNYLSLKYRPNNSISQWVSTNEFISSNHIGIPNHLGRAEWSPSLDTCILPSFSLGNDTSICENVTGLIGISPADPVNSYLWNTGDTTSTVIVNNGGAYWLRIRDRITGCENYDTINVSFLQADSIILPDNVSICDSIQLTIPNSYTNVIWSNGAVGNATWISQDGQYSVSALTASGCQVYSNWVNVIIETPPLIDLGDTINTCNASLELKINNSGVNEYLWSSGATSSTLTVTQSGLYWLQATFLSGCVSTDTVYVNFETSSREIFDNDVFTICDDSTLTLTLDFDLSNPMWSTGGSGMSETFLDSGLYWVQATTPSGCLIVDTFKLVIGISNTYPDLIKEAKMCVDEPIDLEISIPNITPLWPNGSGNKYRVYKPGWVRVVLDDGCSKETHYIEVTAKTCPCQVFMPNAFTPNKNGLNETFGPQAACDFIEYDFRIFSRWGTLIFRSIDPKEHWDGTYNDKIIEGVFPYTLHYKTEYGTGYKQGNITLIH